MIKAQAEHVAGVVKTAKLESFSKLLIKLNRKNIASGISAAKAKKANAAPALNEMAEVTACPMW